MSDGTEKLVLPEDVQIEAKQITIYRGIGSNRGWEYDEGAARRSCANAQKCDRCGAIFKKYFGQMACPGCWQLTQKENHRKLPRQDWDGKGLIHSDFFDEYFRDWDDLFEKVFHDERITPETKFDDLMVRICMPQFPTVSSESILSDHATEDGDDLVNDYKAIDAAVENLNKVILASVSPVYYPSSTAANEPDGWKALLLEIESDRSGGKLNRIE